MDRMFFKLIEELHDCAALANALAMNANYDAQYDECMKDKLEGLHKETHKVQQLLFNAVRHQTAGEPWCKES